MTTVNLSKCKDIVHLYFILDDPQTIMDGLIIYSGMQVQCSQWLTCLNALWCPQTVFASLYQI